jgi:hypothetical protein
MPTGVPPVASEGSFNVGASIEINASREKVWDILTDFKGYKEWCVILCSVESAFADQDTTFLPGMRSCTAGSCYSEGATRTELRYLGGDRQSWMKRLINPSTNGFQESGNQ